MSTPATSTVIHETHCPNISGWPVVGAHLLAFVGMIALGWFALSSGSGALIGLSVILVMAFFVSLCGYTIIEHNCAGVAMFVGKYQGTIRENGLRYTNPLYSVRVISQRTNNFESQKLKVNDLDGNPIEIAAVVVWRVENPASALLSVNDYGNFIKIQSEAALRTLANRYAYDSHSEDKPSLRDNPEQIANELMAHIQERLTVAGIQIIEARISHLAYAQEIAAAMLQRQQASAVVAARNQIVAGAVGMVELAIEELEKKGVVDLDPERRAHMVSNLLVVLCSDRAANPVINAGSLH